MPPQPDEVFEQGPLAALYDYFNPWGAGDEFYLRLARESGGRVLDLGCGTGMLACRMAQEGMSVTGVDPAEGMLCVARSRPGNERVAWVKAHGQSLRVQQPFGFTRHAHSRHSHNAASQTESHIRVNVAARMREMWN
jgi:predicted TPR repeat methyltransferase